MRASTRLIAPTHLDKSNRYKILSSPQTHNSGLNTIFERSKEHLIAFVAIAFISILSRRLKRLVVEELSA
jgi:hypothetical protein